jgi:chromate transporter
MDRGRRSELGALARLFARLSLTAFGGPAAHIALMHEEVVRKRGWLDDGEFLDLVGTSNVIPGPTSTEVAMHTGRRRAGGLGLVVAGLAFIVPAAVVMGVLAWLYRRYGTTPAAGDFFYGVKPVVVVVVARAVYALGRTAVKSRPLAAIGVGALGAYLLGVTEPVVLFAAAATCGVVVAVAAEPGHRHRPPRLPALFLAGPPLVAAGAPGADRLGEIFLVFLKVGALLFGSGYVLFAFLQRDLVEARHWLTESQLLDSIAVGQFTPGPLFTTATFIGYLLAGSAGAVVATVGIFLPSFVFVAAVGPLITRLRRSAAASAALDGLNVAAVALMAGVALRLSQEAVVDATTLAFAVVAAGILWWGKGNSAWLIAAGGVAGLAIKTIS